jgi:SynChlorMet cassette protein ScmC
MELDECAINGSHELIFYRSANTHMVLDGMIDGVPSKSCSYGGSTYLYFYHHRTFRIWCHNSIPDAECEVLFKNGAKFDFINMWFSLHPIYQRSISKGGLPFHAGLAELGGRGALLAASSDTGKSTCCRRLPEHWQPLCDDEALIVLDKNKIFRAHPFPTWSDYIWRESEKTWNIQSSVPLSGIFFLKQSEIDEVAPIGEGEAALLISESAMQICEKFWRNASEEEQRKFRRKLFNNACKMTKQIPAYRLGVSRNGRFWEKMEEVLEW